MRELVPARVVVANPGSVSWMRESAAAFAAAGELDQYVSPTGVSAQDVERIRRSPLPAQLTRRLVTQLEKRQVSGSVGERAVRAGTALDVARVLLARSGSGNRVNAALRRPRIASFDAAVARRLHPGVSAVIGYQGQTTRTFRRAKRLGISRVLDYPIAHPQTVDALFEEELRRNPEFAPALPPQYPPWLRRRHEEEIAAADRIILLSTYQQRTFAAAGIDVGRTFIAPLCVDTDVFTPPSAPPAGPFRVAFVGMIGQHKGLSYLMDAFDRADLGPAAELLMVGQAFAPALWNGRAGVRYVPPMPRNNLPDVLRTCHVVALPSLSDAFGASALEGMACGLPAIVSDRTGVGADVVEDGVDGWVVPARDVDALAQRLRILHQDPSLWKTMSAAARSKAEQYPWQRYRDAVRSGIAPLFDS